MNRILNNWIIIIFSLSFIAIIAALVAEYLYELIPCKMCLKQRYTYYVILFFVIFFYFFKKIKKIWLYIICEFALIYGLYYAIWHSGIERGLIEGPESCSGALIKTDSIKNLKDQISNQSIINCSDISWSIIGISAANVNSILLLFILIFNSIYIMKYFYGSKKIN